MKIHNVAQGSIEWLNLRKGVITGTKAKDVFKADNLPLIDKLIAELGSAEVEESYVTQAMQRGKDLEPIVRLIYEQKGGVKVDEVGFCTHDKYDWIGYSTDGFIKQNGIYKKGIEIKCPNTETHVRYIRTNYLPNEYKRQVIQGFIVNENMESLDFISYDDRFKLKPMHIITINRNDIEFEIQEQFNGLLKFKQKFDKYYNQILF